MTTTTTMATTTLLSLLLTIISIGIGTTTAVDADADAAAGTHDGSSFRAASKSWFFREFLLLELPPDLHRTIVDLVVKKTTNNNPDWAEWIPLRWHASPCTLLLVALVVANLHSWISYHLSGSWVEASHILVKDTSPKTLKALVGLGETLGTDAKTFGLTAQQYSQCPSSAAQKGFLGRFGKSAMAPAFDEVCFDPETPLNTTVGPIQTRFGYHLIYIRDRKL